jgi:hypothetical protein
MNIAFKALPIILSFLLLASVVALPLPVRAQVTPPGEITESYIAPPSESQGNPDDLSIYGIYSKKGNPKLDSALNNMLGNSYSSFSAATDSSQSPVAAEPSIRVIVESIPGCESEVAEASSHAGIVEAEYYGLLQVSLPLSGLLDLANNAGVRFIRQPYQSVPDVIGEGASLINAPQWQAAGYTGSGVKIGVIDQGFSGYQALQSQGEFPGSFYWWDAPSMYWPGTLNHGAACAEIIYDIAPGATYYFAVYSSDVEFGNAVDWMIAQDVDIISLSWSWPGVGPGNGTGPIGQIVDRAYNAGILWAQAAGNYAQEHWNGPWVDTDGDQYLDFRTSPTVDEGNTIWLTSGDEIDCRLNWNDTWGASANDYDLYFYDSSYVLVASSTKYQDGDGDPFERLTYTATYTGNYYIAISRWGDAAPRTLHLFMIYPDSGLNPPQYVVAAGSLAVPADSPRVMTVGAVPWNNPTAIEPFSSRGPNASGVIKPDLVAPDGVSTLTYGASGFWGTSAVAPCAAGAAAIVKEWAPSFTHTQLKSYLESQAVDLGAAGKDNIFGSGRLRLGNPPGKIAFISSPKTNPAGAVSGVITVQAQNASGTPLNVVSNTDINLASSATTGRFDTSASGPFSGAVTKVTIPAGNNSASFYYKDTTRGTPTITAASSGMASGTQQETITAAAATKVRVETAANGSGTVVGAQSLVAGNTLVVYGVTRDQYDNYVANPASTTWSLINKTGGVANSDLSATTGAGVTMTANMAGTAVIHAANGALTPGDSGTITVLTNPFHHLQINTQPASTLSVDFAFNTFAVVMAYDAGNNPVSGVSIVADRDPATGTGALRGTLSAVTNASGVATFSNLGYNKTDAFKVRFTADTKTIISNQVGPLSAGLATTISVATPPVTGASVDVLLATQPVIRVVDQFSNPKNGVVVTASRSTGTGTLRGTLTATSNPSGLAAFTNLGYNKSGEAFSIQFTTASLSVNSVSLGPLAAGVATKVRVETAANGSGTIVWAQSLVTGNTLVVYGVTRDQYDNYVANPASTTWSLINKTGGVANSDLSTTTGASVTMTAHLVGTAVIHAVNGALTPGNSSIITIIAGGGSTTTISIGSPATVFEGETFTVNVNINTVTNYASSQYAIAYNPAVIRVIGVESGAEGITAGLMNGTRQIPVNMWTFSPIGTQGAVIAVQAVPVLQPISGGGYLAQVHFQALPGTAGQSSFINFIDIPGATPPFTRGIWNEMGVAITEVTWTNGSVSIVVPSLSGDANGDGVVNMGDATKVMRIVLGLDPLTLGADANGDGVVNMGDVTRIMRIILGLS